VIEGRVSEAPDIMGAQLNLLDLFDEPTLEALYTPEQIYTSDDPSLYSRLEENPHFERKGRRIAPRDLAEPLSAFGNGPHISGGVVAIGIANDGSIEG
jgi:hypothetical protein